MGRAIPTFMIPQDLAMTLPMESDNDPEILPPGASDVFESNMHINEDYHEDAADIKRIFAQMYYGEVVKMGREIEAIAAEFPSLGMAAWLHMWSKQSA